MLSKLAENIIPASASTRIFPPPSFKNCPIKTLWEEEVFPNGTKSIRVSLNKIEGELTIGIGHWYFNMQAQSWNPNKGQINIPVAAWRSLENLTKTLNDEIEYAQVMEEVADLPQEGLLFIFFIYI